MCAYVCVRSTCVWMLIHTCVCMSVPLAQSIYALTFSELCCSRVKTEFTCLLFNILSTFAFLQRVCVLFHFCVLEWELTHSPVWGSTEKYCWPCTSVYTSLALFPYVGSSASVAVTWIIDVPAGKVEKEEEGQRWGRKANWYQTRKEKKARRKISSQV